MLLDVEASPSAAPSLAADSAFVVAVAFISHFALFRRFGLYEDDYAFIAGPLTWSWGQAGAYVESCIRTLPQGRPIGFIVGSVVPFLCVRLGGLRALPLVYLCGAAVVCLNAFLAHRLLARYGRSFALLGALFFTLYPADTTHPLLTHSLLLQPALTFVLLALLAYARGGRVVAYGLAAGALFTYETGLLPFFAAPLLSPTWDRRLVRRWAGHVAIVFALVGVAVLLRLWVGERRMGEMEGGWIAVPGRIVQAVRVGTAVSLESFVRRSGFAFRQLGPEHLYPAALAALAVLVPVFLRRLATDRADRSDLLRAGTTGLVMLVAGYGLAFTRDHFPPVEQAGRLTSVHMGATLGAAIVWAAAVSMLWTLARRRSARLAAAALTAVFVASLFTFRIVVQRGFVRSAEHQREYWSRIVELLPDLSYDSVVLLRGAEPPRSEFILTSSWADTHVLPLLFRDGSGRAPRLVGGVAPFDESFVEARGGMLWWSPLAPHWLQIDRTAPLPRDVFVLEHTGSGWERRVGSITLGGMALELPPPARREGAGLEKGPLHDLLLAP